MPPRLPLPPQSLASCAEELALRGVQYSEELNSVSAAHTFRSSNKKRWWSHVEGHACTHSWDAVCSSVIKGSGCPFPPCSAVPKRMCGCALCLTFSLADAQHVAALEARGIAYDEDLNSVSAAHTFRSSNKKRWWSHVEGHACTHTWDAECGSVTGGCGCPFPPCSAVPKRMCGCASCLTFSQADAQHVAALEARGIAYDEELNSVPASQTFKSSNDVRWWRHVDGHACSHSWQARCSDVKSRTGCPFPPCSHAPRRLCPCASCLAFSQADTEHVAALAARGIEYDTERNGSAALTFKKSSEKCWWKHTKGHPCAHTWEAVCLHVADGSGCPFPPCNPSAQRLCGCASCISFSQTDELHVATLAARGIEYDAARNTGTASAAVTTKRSGEMRWWRHTEGHPCVHSWDTTCVGVAVGRGCPFPPCNPTPRRLCSCATCLCYSVADPRHVEALAVRGFAYDERNDVPAALTSKCSNEKRTWRHVVGHPCAHTWEAQCGCVARGSGCPKCKNKTEALVRECVAALATAAGWSVGSGALDWCRNAATGRVLPFDMALADASGVVRGIMEVDGGQHFADVAFFRSVCADRLRQDTFKAWTATQRGLFLIRIAQQDLYGDAWPCWRAELGAALALAMRRVSLGVDGGPSHQAYLSSSPERYDGHRAALADAFRNGHAAPYTLPRMAECELVEGASLDETTMESGTPDSPFAAAAALRDSEVASLEPASKRPRA